MRFRNQLIHWLVATAIAMGALAPMLSQAASLVKGGQGFVMEICSADGAQMQMQVLVSSDDVAERANGMQSCPYCLVHLNVIPSFETHLQFQSPQTFAMLPQLFYQSPKPLAIWVTPPSAAPPAQI